MAPFYLGAVMSPLAIVKVALQGASSAIELVESFVPAGKLLTVLNAVDEAIQEALAVLGQAVQQGGASPNAPKEPDNAAQQGVNTLLSALKESIDKEGPAALKASLEKNPAVVAEDDDCDDDDDAEAGNK